MPGDADANERLRAKVPDADLRDRIAAEGDGDRRHTVIVEVEAPSPRLLTRPDLRSGRRRFVPEPDDRSDDAAAQAAATLGELIEKLTGERPPYLGAARAFVLDATGAQIRALADSPLVRSIRPNRRRMR
ncbi:MAG: hypothetical protein AB7K86_03095 [Rhodospirillales bacterium]